MDADELRRESLDRWERSAAGWGARADLLERQTAPVSHRMVEAIRPQPGHRVLELAAGPGDTGLLAAELIQPGGTLISTDQAEAMVDVARARAAARGATNVEFRVLDAESMDLDTASVDGVLCRWGYMLMADPAAALQETRRVLKPGGRVALAVWDAAEHNPWASIPARTLVERGLSQPPQPGQPGMFALADPERLRGMLEDAGFVDVEIEPVEFERRDSSAEDYWEVHLELSRPSADVVEGLDPDARAALRDDVIARLDPYTVNGGELVLPARTLVAAASA
jgi:SAM-dependent methyltransferase